jgi:hypothetical protein
MSESAQHLQLVRLIISEVISTVGIDRRCFVCSDVADGFSLPPLTEEGFRPDVFYQDSNILIIGEAKTSDDIDRLHSKQQYRSYLRKCSLFSGTAILVIAVPWMDHAAIHNIICKASKEYPGKYTVRILDGIGGAI